MTPSSTSFSTNPAWTVIDVVADASPQIVATCHGDILLPCKISQNLRVPQGAVSWYKISDNSEEQQVLQYYKAYNYSEEFNASSEVSNDTWHSLKITNITSYSSGTYKCILRTPVKKYNQSTITLKVIGCLDAKNEKFYRTDLLLLCFLGFFYLLLIFFTCTCLKEQSLPHYHKSRKNHTDNNLISTC
ncbi:CD83 antigen [Varanus komodoensis]|uniref:CD83 antigen n=1 Tax=Varanus komodoensis TaxID=61221 RepID=UPI001CF78B77|nr:CD83 antigen [Varanus komodoensis]